MQGVPRCSMRALAILAAVAILTVFSAGSAAALEPFVTVTSDDGTQYSFYRTSGPVTAVAASSACRAAGGTLASLVSDDQVRATLWDPQVVDAASEDTALLWTGLKITWNNNAAGNRRMLLRGEGQNRQATRNQHDSADEGADDVALLNSLAREMAASTDFVVPTHTRDGRRRLPELLRLWIFQEMKSQSSASSSASSSITTSGRALLARDGISPFLDSAILTWADGSNASFVLSNPSNMGFLACNRKKVSECCGAVFDIGPDPYPGSDFPTMFFYPCGSEKITGALAPAGYMCTIAPPVAELPRPTVRSTVSPSPSPPPSSVPVRKCSAGSMPAAKSSAPSSCVKCKANMYSTDGLSCKKCPTGTSSKKGSKACK